MDDGGYKIIYDCEPYQIDDCGTYMMVYCNHRHIASFKTKELAFNYCDIMRTLQAR